MSDGTDPARVVPPSPIYTDELVTLHARPFQAVRWSGADVAIVDPPYGDTSLPWDQRTVEWIDHVSDGLKPNGSIWLWGSMSSLLDMLPAAKAAGWTVSQEIVWEKHNGSGSASDRFRRVHEFAVLLYRASWADTYHDPQFSLDATPRQVRRKQRPVHWGEIGEASYTSVDGGPRHMRSVMYERSAHGTAIHPTQKPPGITRTLIEYSCPPGGLVIDPYAGSATALVAARACGRRAVGAERNLGFALLAAQRLSAPVQATLLEPANG